MTVTTRIATSAITFATLAFAWHTRAATLEPVSLTGFNVDGVVEANANGGDVDVYKNNGVGLDLGGYWTLFEHGFPGTDADSGLPSDGRITHTDGGDTIHFELADYGDVDGLTSNMLGMSSSYGTTGTLALNSPAGFEKLAFLAFSTNGGQGGEVTLNFDDGSSSTADYEFAGPDWYNNSGYAFTTEGRIDNRSGSFGDETLNPRLYFSMVELTSADQLKTVESITFEKSVYGFATYVTAVSGLVPEPSTLAAMILGGALAGLRRRHPRRKPVV